MRLNPRAVYLDGVAHVPEDRLEEGLIPGFTVAENLMLNAYFQEPYSNGIRLNRGAIESIAAEQVRQYDVRTPSIFNDVGNLSGGNQQKVIVAREFSRPIRLLVAAQPTRGLDVGSIEYIHKRVVEKRDEGTAVLLVSTELDEVMTLGDRIAVMYQGRIVDVIDGAVATPQQLGLLMGGALAGQVPVDAVVAAAAGGGTDGGEAAAHPGGGLMTSPQVRPSTQVETGVGPDLDMPGFEPAAAGGGPGQGAHASLGSRFVSLLGSLLIPALAVFTGLLVGALIVIFSDAEVLGMIRTDPFAALLLGARRPPTPTRPCSRARSATRAR